MCGGRRMWYVWKGIKLEGELTDTITKRIGPTGRAR